MFRKIRFLPLFLGEETGGLPLRDFRAEEKLSRGEPFRIPPPVCPIGIGREKLQKAPDRLLTDVL